MNPLHFLSLLFVALKLCEVIDWSWWAVFAPSLAVLGFWVVIVYGLIRAEFKRH
jgi:hypothetical protein